MTIFLRMLINKVVSCHLFIYLFILIFIYYFNINSVFHFIPNAEIFCSSRLELIYLIDNETITVFSESNGTQVKNSASHQRRVI